MGRGAGETVRSEPTPTPALSHYDRATATLGTSQVAPAPLLPGGAAPGPSGPRPMAP